MSRKSHRTKIKGSNFDTIADRAVYQNWARKQTEKTKPMLVIRTMAELGFPYGATGEQILAKLREMNEKRKPTPYIPYLNYDYDVGSWELGYGSSQNWDSGLFLCRSE